MTVRELHEYKFSVRFGVLREKDDASGKVTLLCGVTTYPEDLDDRMRVTISGGVNDLAIGDEFRVQVITKIRGNRPYIIDPKLITKISYQDFSVNLLRRGGGEFHGSVDYWQLKENGSVDYWQLKEKD